MAFRIAAVAGLAPTTSAQASSPTAHAVTSTNVVLRGATAESAEGHAVGYGYETTTPLETESFPATTVGISVASGCNPAISRALQAGTTAV